MKYKYNTEFLDINGHKRFYFKMQNELRIIEDFINSDIQSEHIGKKVIEYCIQVQDGILKEYSFNGNSCSTTIMPDYTEIKNRYAEENNVCSIETSELILLIEAFINEKKRHIVQNK